MSNTSSQYRTGKEEWTSPRLEHLGTLNDVRGNTTIGNQSSGSGGGNGRS